MSGNRKKPLVLTILDGWGFSPALAGNAIAVARKPIYETLLREFPNTLIHLRSFRRLAGRPDGE